MKINSITLNNFRCYKQLVLDFHPKITVLVADNGQGKTAILDAVRIALWPYVSQFDLSKSKFADPANTITIDDVRIIKRSSEAPTILGALEDMARQMPSEITAFGDYGQGDLSWQRYRNSEADKSQTKDDKGCRQLKAYSKNIQFQIRNLNQTIIDLPVFGYYGTGRLWKEKRLTEAKKGDRVEIDNESIRTFAYRDCLDPASSYRQFEQWFTSAYKQILENQIQQLEQGAEFIKIDPQIKVPVKVVQIAVNEVLKPTGWQQLQYSERYNKTLVLKHKELGIMKASLLSDGIKNVLAMVADIAYRCVLLNGHLGEDAATKSKGIVMIDEIDMHLHPSWQQTVIKSLQIAFPNIQFIVTTHSPQVLSTVASESIRVIKHQFDKASGIWLSTAEPPLLQSQGVASADVMADIQGVDPIPNILQAQWLVQYKNLIIQGKHDSDEGTALKQKILNHFGDKHHEWLECERIIRLQAMKAKISRKS